MVEGCRLTSSFCPHVSVTFSHSTQVAEVIEAAKRAKEAGSTRFCMGAAWRELGNKKKAFNNILDMVGPRLSAVFYVVLQCR